MVMRPEPLFAAIEPLREPARTGHPAGPGRRAPDRCAGARACAASRTWRSSAAATRGSTSGCGPLVDREVSIGDYVLTGGELPALVAHRRGRAARARRDPGGVARGRLVRGGPARAPAVHAARRCSASWPCRRSCCPGTTARSTAGVAARPCAERSSAGRTCSRRRRLTDADRAASSTSSARRRLTPSRLGCRVVGCPATSGTLYSAVAAAARSRSYVTPISRGSAAITRSPQDERHQGARARAAPHRRTGDRPRRHRARVGEGGRGHPRADPGLRGHRHADARRRPEPGDHRASHRQRRRRGAHLHGARAADREDRGRPPRRRPPRPALLPARPGRQVRHASRAPPS